MTEGKEKQGVQEDAGDDQQDAAHDHGHMNGNGNGSHLGMAGRMAQTFVHSPLTPLLFLAMLAMGIMGLIVTPRQEDPQISVPMIDVYIKFPGASAEEVASLAIEPLERIMSEIPAVKHVYAAAERDQGLVIVRFKVGEDLGRSIVKVHDKIQSNLDKIPPGVEHPLVKPVGIDDVPVVTLTLWSEHLDQGQLRTLANDILQRLKEVPLTGAGFVVGGLREQIRVQVMPERLSGFNVSLDQVAHTIRTANSEQKAGSTESYGQHFTVYTGSFLQTVQDVANLVVTTREGAPVYVRDIAHVTEEPEEPKSLVSYYTGKEYPGESVARGQPAVTIALAKKIGSNGVEVANNILAKIEALKNKDLGLITPDVHVEVTRNYGKTADDKVTSLIKKLFIATGAVTILVWLALGWRPAIVVTLVVPVVLLMTIFSAWLGGFTIDRVSLFALIFSIGILVDDAIVVIENIYRRWLMKGETDTETVIDAVREVGNPTILATFTVVAALMPMAFVTGMMGPYMSPIPSLGSVAMILSLFAAFVFVPYLAMRIKPGMYALKKAEESEERDKERIARVFDKLLVPLIESRQKGNIFLVTLIAAFFFVCMFFVWKWVPVKMLPYDNKPEFSVVINMPSGSALPATANFTSTVAERLRNELPHITAIQTYVGTARPFDFNGMVRHYYMRNKPWHAEIQVQLKDKTERDDSSHELAVMARQIVDEIAGEYNRRHRQGKGVRTTVVEMPPGPPVLQTVVAEIYGPDKETRQHAARMMTHIFENTEGMADIDNYLQDDYEVWRFEVDTEKAVRRGISVDTINRNLAMALGENRLGDVKRGSVLEPTYIVLEVPLSERSDISRLGDLPIPMANGQGMIPLAELGKFERSREDDIIFYKDLRPVEYVVGDAVGELGAPIYPMLKVEEELQKEKYKTLDGVNMGGEYMHAPYDRGVSAFKWDGEWTVTYETFRDMGIAFAVALVLIYMLVVWEFGNFLVPAIIMAPIPLTMLGIVPGHLIFDAEFTATSMIGFIALSGIIVRNSILLVDFAIHEVRLGATNAEAVVLACRARTRPIMITALALVAGSFVIVTDPIFQGMAISLLFGVMVSSVLTLIVIPLGCISAGRHLCPDCELLPPQGGGEPQGGAGVEGDKQSWPEVVWARTLSILVMAFYTTRAVMIIAWMGAKGVFNKISDFALKRQKDFVAALKRRAAEKKAVEEEIKAKLDKAAKEQDKKEKVAKKKVVRKKAAEKTARETRVPAQAKTAKADEQSAPKAKPSRTTAKRKTTKKKAVVKSRKKPMVRALVGTAQKPESTAVKPRVSTPPAKKSVQEKRPGKKTDVKTEIEEKRVDTQDRESLVSKAEDKIPEREVAASTLAAKGKATERKVTTEKAATTGKVKTNGDKPTKAKQEEQKIAPPSLTEQAVSRQGSKSKTGRRGIRLNPNI